MHGRFTDQRSWVLWAAVDLALVSAAALAAESAGSHWDSANRTILGITPAEIISAT
jgi:hypothetical protein